MRSSENELADFLKALLKKDKKRIKVLNVIKEISDEELWIAGGFVRNMVWDHLHGFKKATALEDIDVFFYSSVNIDKSKDLAIQHQLIKLDPTFNWSVKNQARMHLHNNEPQYSNLSEALEKFPETSSAVAVRLTGNNDILVLAPLGLKDLFGLRIVPTPHMLNNELSMSKYRARVIKKDWKRQWPLLKIDFLDFPSTPC